MNPQTIKDAQHQFDRFLVLEEAHATEEELEAQASRVVNALTLAVHELNGHHDVEGYAMPTAAELVAKDLPPQEWIVKTLFRKGTTAFIFGPSYSGKSMLSTQLGLSLALGHDDFLGFELPDKPTTVGYFMGENDETELRANLVAMCENGAPDQFRYCDVLSLKQPHPLATVAGLAWYRATVKQNAIEVAILDNLMSLAGADLKDSETADKVMGGLKRISKETGVSWLLVGHTRKEGSKGDEGGFLDRLYGAHEWGSWCDHAFYVGFQKGAERDDPKREIHVAKTRGARPTPGFLVEMHPEHLTTTYLAELGKKATGKPSMNPALVLEYVRNNPGITTIEDIRTSFGVHRSTVYRLIDSDQWQGWIDDGTIAVEAKGNRGGPTAFRCRTT